MRWESSGLTLPDDHGVAIAVVVIIGASFVALGWLVTRAILRAAEFEPTAMVTVALSALTLVAIVAFTITGDRVLGTIAATGFGALASTVTFLLIDKPTARHRRPRLRRRGGGVTMTETDSDKGDES